MSGLPNGFLVSTLITDLFSIENQLDSSDHADLFKAYDQDRGRSVAVWIFRDQFDPTDDRLALFVKRMGRLANAAIPVPKLFSVGLDPSGLLFSVVEYVDGFSIDSGNMDMREAERRWVSALHIVEQLHEQQMTLQTNALRSFWVTRAGMVTLVNCVGDPTSSESAAQGYRADIDLLIRLGIALFAKVNKVDYNNKTISADLLTHYLKAAPKWIFQILEMAITSPDKARTATELAQAFRTVKEKLLEEESQVSQRGDRSLHKKNTDTQLQVFDGKSKEGKEDAETSEQKKGISKKVRLIAGMVVGLMLLIVMTVAISMLQAKTFSTTDSQVTETLRNVADDRVRQAIDVLSSADVAITEKRRKYAELAQSDDPVAHSLLVENAVRAVESSERILAEKAILSRGKRLGLEMLAQTVGAWLETLSVVAPPAEYELVLKIVDGTLPAQGRGELVERIFAINRTLGLQLITGLCLTGTTEQQQQYAESVRHILNALEPTMVLPALEVVRPIVLLGLYVHTHPELLHAFSEQVKGFSEEELRWLCITQLSKNQAPSQPVITETSHRKVFGDYTAVYLHPLTLNEAFPEGTLLLISRLLKKDVTNGEIEQLGIWLNSESYTLLKTLLIELQDPQLISEAWDYVAGRSGGDAFTVQLLSDLRQYTKQMRTVWAPLIGVSGIEAEHSAQTLERAFLPLRTIEPWHPVFSTLLRSPNQMFLTAYLKEFHERIPAGAMIALLSNIDKSVRISAIHALKEVNQTSVLQIILEAYKAEHDPEVRRTYEQELWIIKERIKS